MWPVTSRLNQNGMFLPGGTVRAFRFLLGVTFVTGHTGEVDDASISIL